MKYSATILLCVCLLFAHSPNQATSAECNPLLLMIEGGDWSSNGDSIEDLANEIDEDYKEMGIDVFPVDGSKFWSSWRYFKNRSASQLAHDLRLSGYYPLVIVGHSLGGATAHALAERVETSLLVTLDAVSFNDNQARPRGAAKWVNAYVGKNAWLVWNGNAVGPDWDDEPHADVDFHAGYYSHSNVRAMYKKKNPKDGMSAEDWVLEALKYCPSGQNYREFNPGSLCRTGSIACRVEWEVTNSCSHKQGIGVKFFELDSDMENALFSWGQRTIPPKENYRFSGECESPTNFICLGAQKLNSDSGSWWGMGITGDKKPEQGLCAACRHVQDARLTDGDGNPDRYLIKDNLVCPSSR